VGGDLFSETARTKNGHSALWPCPIHFFTLAMSFRDDFEEPQEEWDDAIDFGEVTETGSNVSEVRECNGQRQEALIL
jgi:hypothetical protein